MGACKVLGCIREWGLSCWRGVGREVRRGVEIFGGVLGSGGLKLSFGSGGGGVTVMCGGV